MWLNSIWVVFYDENGDEVAREEFINDFFTADRRIIEDNAAEWAKERMSSRMVRFEFE